MARTCKWGEKEMAAVYLLMSDGVSYRRCADQLGMKLGTVQRIVAELRKNKMDPKAV